jgi:hypothetical protein
MAESTGNAILMLPPQLQVGAGQHTLNVTVHENGPQITVQLLPAAGRKVIADIPNTQRAERVFDLTEWPTIPEWLTTEGTRIGAHLDKIQKQELRRKGYRV